MPAGLRRKQRICAEALSIRGFAGNVLRRIGGPLIKRFRIEYLIPPRIHIEIPRRQLPYGYRLLQRRPPRGILSSALAKASVARALESRTTEQYPLVWEKHSSSVNPPNRRIVT